MPYTSEAELCLAFAAECRQHGWTIYPESQGWDMLLVRGKTQVGVQAKLQANIQVLLQALPDVIREGLSKPTRGPQYRLVLVGGFVGRTFRAQCANRSEFVSLAKHLRLLVACPGWFSLDTWMISFGNGYPHNNLMTRYAPIWRSRKADGRGANPYWPIAWRWYRWREQALKLPAVIPDVPAGVPSPEQVTPWSMAAVLLERRCEANNGVTPDDARAVRDIVGGTWNPSTLLARYFKYSAARGRWGFHPHWARPSERHRGTARSLKDKNEQDLLEAAGQTRMPLGRSP